MNRTISLPVFALALFTQTAGPLLAASDPHLRQYGKAFYFSGGASERARERLQSMGRDFNLKLILATRTGAMLFDAHIAVDDEKGMRMLDAHAEGPVFYAKLPQGRYEVAAYAKGSTVREAVTLDLRNQKMLDLRWDD